MSVAGHTSVLTLSSSVLSGLLREILFVAFIENLLQNYKNITLTDRPSHCYAESSHFYLK